MGQSGKLMAGEQTTWSGESGAGDNYIRSLKIKRDDVKLLHQYKKVASADMVEAQWRRNHFRIGVYRNRGAPYLSTGAPPVTKGARANCKEGRRI